MNKLKGCSSSIKMKYLIFVFVSAVIVALPTRVYQLLALIDSQTGFYESKDITVPVLYGICAVFCCLFLVLSFLSKEVPSPKLPTGKNAVLGVGSIAAAVGLLWDILAVFKSIVPGYEGEGSSFVSILQINFQQSGGWIVIVKLLAAFFGIFWFLIFGVSHLNGKASYKEYKLLALCPVIWSVATLINKLMNAVSFITVSELLFEICLFVFATVFFLTVARISTGVFTEDGMWIIYGCGFSATLFAGIVSVPRLVCLMASAPLVEGHSFSLTHFAIFVFALCYILASLGIGFKDGLKNRRVVDSIILPDDADVVVKSRRNSAFDALLEDDFSEFADKETAEEVVEEETEETQEEPEYELVDTFDTAEIISEMTDESLVEEIFDEPAVDDALIEESVVDEEIEAFFENIEETVVDEAEADEETESDIEEPFIQEATIKEETEDFFEDEDIDTVEPETEVDEGGKEAKPKKEKKTFFSRKRAAPDIDEIPDDLMPVSLADLKKKD